MSPKIQRTASAFWPITLLILAVIMPLELYNVYRKQKEMK